MTHDSLERVLLHIHASAWPAELVAMTGDVIQDDSRAAYERFREMLTPLDLPVHCVPGNHDLKPLMQAVLDREPFRYCDSTIYGNWLVAGVDSCLEGNPAGRVAEHELERIGGILGETAAEHAMICLHHPPLPVGSRWLDEVGLRNGAQFLERIAVSAKVRVAIFGHVHQAFDGMFNSIRIIGTPSTCTQFEAGSESYAVSDEPPAYRRMGLHADGRVDAELVWLGSEK